MKHGSPATTVAGLLSFAMTGSPATTVAGRVRYPTNTPPAGDSNASNSSSTIGGVWPVSMLE